MPAALSPISTLNGKISAPASLNGKISLSINQSVAPPPIVEDIPSYEGEYTVSADAFDQTVLPTKNKKLTNDITIEPVTFSAVTNTAGGTTITIATR